VLAKLFAAMAALVLLLAVVLPVGFIALIGGALESEEAEVSGFRCATSDVSSDVPVPDIAKYGIPNACKRWRPAIERAARRNGLETLEEVSIFRALVHKESWCQTDLVSSAGAYGLAQLMPGTATWLGVDRYNVSENLDGGARYFRQQLDAFDGNVELALAAYNAGPTRVKKLNGIPPIPETQAYVPAVLGLAVHLYGADPENLVCDPEEELDRSPRNPVNFASGGTPSTMAWGGHSNGRIPASELAPVGSYHRLRSDAARDFIAMREAYRRDTGFDLLITDSYRSYEAQVVCKRLKPILCAVPGTSNHGWGLAVDVNFYASGGHSRLQRWLYANAPRYGWHHPAWARPSGSKPEEWHWEYWGKNMAGFDMPSYPPSLGSR
jgi:hypothetical protein